MTEQLVYAAAARFEAARRLDGRLHGHSFVANLRAVHADERQLQERLARCVAPLDYADLNRQLEVPTDENLAHWLRSRLDLPGRPLAVGVQSTLRQGVELDQDARAHLWRRYAFQAAHRLPRVPAGHKCGRMHGHGFEVILRAAQEPGARVDYERLDALWAPLHHELDHACLNDLAGLENPTSELIASWIWGRLKARLPALARVTVYETASCGAHFDGQGYRIWKDFSLDSAVRLSRAPAGDPRRRIHGHSYTLRLQLQAPLDELLGWTVDYGDVKELFQPVFLALDHHPLYELPGVGDNDVASLLRWIRGQCAQRVPAIDRIDLYETPGCGASLSWGA